MAARKSAKARLAEAPPRVRKLVALWPLLVLDLLVGVWLARHFDTIKLGASFGGVLTIATIWGVLTEETQKGIKFEIVKALKSPVLATPLWIAAGVVFVGIWFVTSVHVGSANPSGRTQLYGIEQLSSSQREIAAGRIDALHPNLRFVLLTWPAGRRIAVQTADGLGTEIRRATPWSPASFTHPSDFEALPALHVLPTASYLVDFAGQAKLTVTVQRLADGDTLARDTIASVTSLIISSRKPPKPDTAQKTSWTSALATLLKIEPAQAEPLVNDWMDPRWFHASRPLQPDERIEITVSTATGEVLSRDTVTIIRPVTYAIVRKKS